jgi:hypothetical protein
MTLKNNLENGLVVLDLHIIGHYVVLKKSQMNIKRMLYGLENGLLMLAIFQKTKNIY